MHCMHMYSRCLFHDNERGEGVITKYSRGQIRMYVHICGILGIYSTHAVQ